MRISLRPFQRVLALALAGFSIALTSAPAHADSAPASCDKVASPAGSDSGSGSTAAPLRTAQALVDALAPGQVGCLRAGTYPGGLRVDHGGTSAAAIVLRSFPGERALVTGRFYVPQGSDYVTIADLNLDGNPQSDSELLPSPTINANHVTFEADDVTNDNTEICFLIGGANWGVADSTVISGDHIHNCGALPAANHDHGIYVEDATNTRIVGNLIDHNADRGIQLFPSSTGAVIAGNVISENGEGIIFSGEGGVASNGNVVERNLIVNSLIRSDIESWYPSGNPLGVGNVAQHNCVSGRGIDTGAGGFAAAGNVTASSNDLIATAGGGYRPAAGSACAGVVPELVNGLAAVEGILSGGAPTPVGKEAGGGSTPAPAQGAPAGESTPTHGETLIGGGSTPTPEREAVGSGFAPTSVGRASAGGLTISTGAPAHHKRHKSARKRRSPAQAARARHTSVGRSSRAGRARSTRPRAQ
jgi:parallel beta-helix repeat protein